MTNKLGRDKLKLLLSDKLGRDKLKNITFIISNFSIIFRPILRHQFCHHILVIFYRFLGHFWTIYFIAIFAYQYRAEVAGVDFSLFWSFLDPPKRVFAI
jgi:hypothetical protein